MRSVDRLFTDYKAAFRAGGDADPRAYLEQVAGTDRTELAALIDAFLARAPAPAFDAAAFERFKADPRSARLVAAVEQRMDERLPDLRAAAEIAREELVGRLAEDLGVAPKRTKVADYYHRLEWGRLDPRPVSGRVWDSLARMFGVSAERVRDAAARAVPPPAAGAPVMARAVHPPADLAAAAPAAPPPAALDEEPSVHDEVDDLFLGGA